MADSVRRRRSECRSNLFRHQATHFESGSEGTIHMTIEEQIAELNDQVRCRLGTSPIHGIGVFAMRSVAKGDKLFTAWDPYGAYFYHIPLNRFDELRPEIRALILDRWAMPDGGRPFRSPNADANLMSFMNHSDQPNCEYGIALRDIEAGEEITEHYLELGAPLHPMQMQHYSFLKEI